MASETAAGGAGCELYRHQITVDPSLPPGVLIGKGGAKIKLLQANHIPASVRFDYNADGALITLISHDREALKRARRGIERHLAALVSRRTWQVVPSPAGPACLSAHAQERIGERAHGALVDPDVLTRKSKVMKWGSGDVALGLIVSKGGQHTPGVLPLTEPLPGGARIARTFLSADMAGAVGKQVAAAARRKTKEDSHLHRKGGKAHARYSKW
jgi:hypothetical protein